ncbi:10754_t:CDS:2, partial [Racocetra fulgida]
STNSQYQEIEQPAETIFSDEENEQYLDEGEKTLDENNDMDKNNDTDENNDMDKNNDMDENNNTDENDFTEYFLNNSDDNMDENDNIYNCPPIGVTRYNF